MAAQRQVSAPGYRQGPIEGYRDVRSYGVGMWAWLLQRVSGVLLIFFVFAHFWIKVLFPTWGVVPMAIDLMLILLVTYHGFSGLRTVLIDFGAGVRAQRVVFFSTVALALITAAFAVTAYLDRYI